MMDAFGGIVLDLGFVEQRRLHILLTTRWIEDLDRKSPVTIVESRKPARGLFTAQQCTSPARDREEPLSTTCGAKFAPSEQRNLAAGFAIVQ